MPPLTRWSVKAALVYLVLALLTGIFLALPGGSSISGLFPVYFHALAFGWLTQLIFGIAFWMFPKYSTARPRGHEWLGWAAFILLNTGLILRIVFEPLHGMAPSALRSWMLVLAAVL
jgi:heme/copper-type cytochrome/quinol oxidase subunit 1